MNDSILIKESFNASLIAIKLCSDINRDHLYVIGNQLLRSTTSIGANLKESQYAESKLDFIHKLKIALKECNETLYWLELIKESPILPYNVDELYYICKVMLKMLIKSINTCNSNLK